jgi:hypothetical protein
MESDIGNPIEYTSDIMDKQETSSLRDVMDEQQEEQPMYYYAPPPPPPPSPYPMHTEKIDLFSNLDKTAYIVIFVAFILGFFMGKTMQPVILRPG